LLTLACHVFPAVLFVTLTNALWLLDLFCCFAIRAARQTLTFALLWIRRVTLFPRLFAVNL
jgi:hypothetical protein